MTVAASIRAAGLEKRLRRYAALYAADAAEVPRLQLERLNAAWGESLARSPWARAQQKRLGLPSSFSSWAELADRAPVQRKADFKHDLSTGEPCSEPVVWRATGGTTAEPFRFPAFASEAAEAALDIWLGRGRLGIRPDHRLFMIWGHSHLFGTGLKGLVAKTKRRLSDAALGYTRWNAYKLAPEDLAAAAEALLRSRARYVIGYSSALDRFARASLPRAGEIHAMGLACVIATAEGMPQADSREVMEQCFGCPVVMEYGCVETGPMAYERLTGGYDVFWANHHLELLGPPSEGPQELVVTSLTPRAMPLLRYAVGDLVRVGAGQDVAIELETAIGRCNDVVTLPNGAPIHSEAFTHAVRDMSHVRAYQIVRPKDGGLPTIRLETERALGPSALDAVRKRLGKIDPSLEGVAFETVAHIEVSVAGKHRMVVDEA